MLCLDLEQNNSINFNSNVLTWRELDSDQFVCFSKKVYMILFHIYVEWHLEWVSSQQKNALVGCQCIFYGYEFRNFEFNGLVYICVTNFCFCVSPLMLTA